MANNQQLCNVTEDALAKLVELVHAGIAHGYFEASIVVRDSSAGRSEIVITAGKQFRFLLPKQ
jgi:hypothetical protein